MLKIRLQRVGRKNDPSFRVVATESKNGPQSGKFLEVLGSYDARKGEPVFSTDRIKHWMSKGALLSDTVHNLLVSKKVIDGKKINVLPKKSPIVKEKTEDPKSENSDGASEKKAEAEASKPAEAPVEGVKEEPTKEEVTEAPVETPAEEAKEEVVPAEETKAE